MSEKSQSVGSEIYSDTASFGRFWAKFGFVIAIIFGVLFIIAGIYIVTHKFNRVHVLGKVKSTDPSPCPYITGNRNQYQCNITIQYNVKGVVYEKTLWYNSGRQPSSNSDIDIYYKKNNPSDVTIEPPPTKLMGIGLIGFGVIIPLVAYFIVWLTRRNKFVASAVGVGGALDIIRGL